MLQSTKVLILLGIALAVAGVIAGALPFEAGLGASCGPVFSPGNPYIEPAVCATERSTRALFTWGPIVTGAILVFGAVLIDPSFGRKSEEAK
ncbi:hypothetical protein [Nocardiopsis synnemataformans]|uniref:hypothetical protein n=1 Tax=Nocardiopsis synnemataformans TaxID=61305 RepID=UPI003EB984B0